MPCDLNSWSSWAYSFIESSLAIQFSKYLRVSFIEVFILSLRPNLVLTINIGFGSCVLLILIELI